MIKKIGVDVEKFTDPGEKDDGAWGVFIQFYDEEGSFALDFCFGVEISTVIGDSFPLIAESFGGYVSGKDVFFKQKTKANMCKKALFEILKKECVDEDFKERIKMQIEKQALRLEERWPGDAERIRSLIGEFVYPLTVVKG